MTLTHWLTGTTRSPAFASFQLEDVVEHGPPDDAAAAALARAILDAKSSMGFLEQAAAVLGWDAVAARVAGGRTRVRRGDFGEALTATWFAEQHALQTPVPKLRYQVSADQTQPGTDIVALAITPEPLAVTAIHLTECKLRTRRNLASGEDAHSQLITHREADFAEVVLFVLERLYFEARELHDALLKHLETRQSVQSATDRFEIALIYDAAVWDERVLARIDAVAGDLAPLRVHSLRVDGLASLIDRAFGSVSAQVVIEEDACDVDATSDTV
jgi:hypothetical protein